jgi:hypothetical protein
MSSQARDPSERIAAALEAIAHSLAVGVELQRDKRRAAAGKAATGKRYPKPPTRPEPADQLAVKRRERAGKTADAALRKLGIP